MPSIPYEFYGGNRDAILCRDREVILAGPAESGKTLGLLWKIHTLAYKYPGCQIGLIRKVKADIYGSVYRTFQRDLLENYGPGIDLYGGRHRPQEVLYPGGSKIWIGGLDDPGKTLSSERDVIYVNQTEELSFVDWEYLTRCVTGRGAVMPYTQLIGDCNPGPRSHWILQRRNSGALTFFESTHKDNPTLWDRKRECWTRQGLDTRDTLARMTGARLMRLYHGLWVSPEGAIYDVFDDELGKHRVASFDPPRSWPRFVGIDPAGAYRSAVWLAYDPQAKVLNAYRELLVPHGSTVARFVSKIKELSKGETVFAWVCGAKSERDWRAEFEGAGLPVVEPPIADVWVGIDRVYDLLRDFALVVHSNCTNLISEIGEYSRVQDKRSGDFVDKIDKKETYHMLDALRYAIVHLSQPQEARDLQTLPLAQIGPRY